MKFQNLFFHLICYSKLKTQSLEVLIQPNCHIKIALKLNLNTNESKWTIKIIILHHVTSLHVEFIHIIQSKMKAQRLWNEIRNSRSKSRSRKQRSSKEKLYKLQTIRWQSMSVAAASIMESRQRVREANLLIHFC